MKKITLGVLFLAFASATLHAQEPKEPLRNKNGYLILPEKGDFAIGFNTVPIFAFFGNMFNGNMNNNFMSQNKFVSFLDDNAIYGKYFLSDKNAVRVDFRLGIHSGKFRNDVYNDYANSPDSLVVDAVKLSTQRFTLGAAYEWRVGKGRLQGVFGAGVFFKYASSVKARYEYGNAMTNGNAAPTTTTWDMAGNVLASGPQAQRTLWSKGGNTCGFGARGFVGVEYFVAPKISLGAEFGWSAGYSQTSAIKSQTESFDSNSNTVVNTDRTRSGSRFFDADTDNFNGALYLMFHF